MPLPNPRLSLKFLVSAAKQRKSFSLHFPEVTIFAPSGDPTILPGEGSLKCGKKNVAVSFSQSGKSGYLNITTRNNQERALILPWAIANIIMVRQGLQCKPKGENVTSRHFDEPPPENFGSISFQAEFSSARVA